MFYSSEMSFKRLVNESNDASPDLACCIINISAVSNLYGERPQCWYGPIGVCAP